MNSKLESGPNEIPSFFWPAICNRSDLMNQYSWFTFIPNKSHLCIVNTRGPWTASPALIKVKETGKVNKQLYICKNVINWCNFSQKCPVCVQLHIFGPEGSFTSSSLNRYNYIDWPILQSTPYSLLKESSFQTRYRLSNLLVYLQSTKPCWTRYFLLSSYILVLSSDC